VTELNDATTVVAAAGVEITLDGLVCVDVVIRAGLTMLTLAPQVEPGRDEAGWRPARVSWRWPLDLPVTLWRPSHEHPTALPAAWWPPVATESTRSAPVGALVDPADRNVLTYALSTARTTVDIAAGLEEETATCLVSLTLPERAGAVPGPFLLRLDARPAHFANVLADVDRWWQEQLTDDLLPVPAAATRPAYSTWYSMHQLVTPAAIEAQAEQAEKLGCAVVIVDDGWQTTNTGRGYAYCGDWLPSPAFPDMRAHVRAVQKLGLRYVLWYALPLLGKNTRAAAAFVDHTLGWDPGLDAYVLDPRFPDVRRHLSDIVLRGIRDFGLDGVKLDFLDTFANFPAGPREGIDCETVAEGCERLLATIIDEGSRLRPELLVEFRQPYIAPGMWRYANFLRAADCPFDAGENRVRTVDLRLLSGGRAVHSDMLMWNIRGSAEAAALQLISVLFSVPQISVLLHDLPAGHRQMLTHWIALLQEYREVLLSGRLRPHRPDLRYPLVEAEHDGIRVTAAYADMPVDSERGLRMHIVVNGTPHAGLTIRATGEATVTITDCRGRTMNRTRQTLTATGTTLDIPVAGYAMIEPETR
jgi:alpha-galactosidase